VLRILHFLKLQRDMVKNMFYHAYDSYMLHAFPKDELKPISCAGEDTLGGYVAYSFYLAPPEPLLHISSITTLHRHCALLLIYGFRYSLTLIDALDTLVVCLIFSFFPSFFPR
jgi:hypothetical protein